MEVTGGVTPGRLSVIGYWAGPGVVGTWPSVLDFVDLEWDEDDRDFISHYLTTRIVARTYMGCSTCRVCGKPDNGAMELTDGTYVWPDGLPHYVSEHDVRLPEWFVDHACANIELLETAERETETWQAATLADDVLIIDR